MCVCLRHILQFSWLSHFNVAENYAIIFEECYKKEIGVTCTQKTVLWDFQFILDINGLLKSFPNLCQKTQLDGVFRKRTSPVKKQNNKNYLTLGGVLWSCLSFGFSRIGSIVGKKSERFWYMLLWVASLHLKKKRLVLKGATSLFQLFEITG